MRNLPLNRTQAEWLVDLLEEGCDPAKHGSWRHDLSAEIRLLFGMCTREESEFVAEQLKKKTKQ